jgi:hypothetical protein
MQSGFKRTVNIETIAIALKTVFLNPQPAIHALEFTGTAH